MIYAPIGPGCFIRQCRFRRRWNRCGFGCRLLALNDLPRHAWGASAKLFIWNVFFQWGLALPMLLFSCLFCCHYHVSIVIKPITNKAVSSFLRPISHLLSVHLNYSCTLFPFRKPLSMCHQLLSMCHQLLSMCHQPFPFLYSRAHLMILHTTRLNSFLQPCYLRTAAYNSLTSHMRSVTLLP